jgi:uncharacterized membrane protein
LQYCVLGRTLRGPWSRLAYRLAVMSYVQAVLLVGIVLAAVAMARGFGVPA